MLNKLQAVESRYEELCAKSEQPDFYADPQKAAKLLREKYCGGLDEQIGLCWGHSNQLNALEWHTCNEFNIAVRELVLLLAKMVLDVVS